MPTTNTENTRGKAPVPDLPEDRKPAEERDRLRDIIVVFVTYPLTPTEKTDRLAKKKPWLEFTSLLLKVLLAIYALYEALSKAN